MDLQLDQRPSWLLPVDSGEVFGGNLAAATDEIRAVRRSCPRGPLLGLFLRGHRDNANKRLRPIDPALSARISSSLRGVGEPPLSSDLRDVRRNVGCMSGGDLNVLRFRSTSRKIRKMRPPADFDLRNNCSDVWPLGARGRIRCRLHPLMVEIALRWRTIGLMKKGKLQSRSPSSAILRSADYSHNLKYGTSS